MIYSVVSKEEMEGYGTNQVFRYYREALGKYNIKLAVVDVHDPLDFVKKGDIVLLRTANEHLLRTIKEKNIVSTAEEYDLYEMVKDKAMLATYLTTKGIRVPEQFSLDEVEDGKVYFVKPRFGSDSMGINAKSVCRSKAEVECQMEYLNSLGMEPIIEEYIDGMDCTVACVYNDFCIKTYAIDVECSDTDGIQTRDCKVGFKECCSALRNSDIELIAEMTFAELGIQHHARIDFRRSKRGLFYMIDVNLMPGLGPLDHYAKCLLLTENISYTDAIKTIIRSAS